jgi:hypothetical protein
MNPPAVIFSSKYRVTKVDSNVNISQRLVRITHLDFGWYFIQKSRTVISFAVRESIRRCPS